ncbi:MAG: DUF6089 family protein [Bacteroidota bacterium]
MKHLLIILLSLTVAFGVQAQQGWEAGGWVGASNYFGDLNTNFDMSSPGLAAGVLARYNFNERIAVRFSGNFGQIAGDDADSKNDFERARNLNFRSNVVDGSVQLEFNFLPYIHGSREQFFTPYLTAGVVVFNFEPETQFQGEWVELRPLGTEGQFRGEEYFSTQLGFGYGGGVKVSLGYEWSLNVHIDSRWLFTDYLDDVSTIYADPGDIENLRGETAAALSNRAIDIPGVEGDFSPGRQRGNEFNNDTYVFAGVGITYYFGDLRCPKVSRRN